MANRISVGKKAAAAIVAVMILACSAGRASAEPPSFQYPSDGDHPLRVVHYFVAPVGGLLEWTVFRPLAVLGQVIAPFQHIGARTFKGCSRERPARSCTNVVK